MHMGSGFCLCAGAASPTPRGAVKTAPCDAKDKRAAMAGLRAGHARPLRGGGSTSGPGGMNFPLRITVTGGRRAASPLAAAGVYGGGRFTDSRCRGRRPRRPAEVSGDGRYTGGMNSSPTDIPLTAVSREVAEGSRPLPTKQTVKGDSTVRLRAGHARPLQGIHDSHALASACATFSTSSSFRAEYPATTVSARQSSGRAR